MVELTTFNRLNYANCTNNPVRCLPGETPVFESPQGRPWATVPEAITRAMPNTEAPSGGNKPRGRSLQEPSILGTACIT
jgi:hypothetical protein